MESERIAFMFLAYCLYLRHTLKPSKAKQQYGLVSFGSRLGKAEEGLSFIHPYDYLDDFSVPKTKAARFGFSYAPADTRELNLKPAVSDYKRLKVVNPKCQDVKTNHTVRVMSLYARSGSSGDRISRDAYIRARLSKFNLSEVLYHLSTFSRAQLDMFLDYFYYL